jgi:hypothetical protein
MSFPSNLKKSETSYKQALLKFTPSSSFVYSSSTTTTTTTIPTRHEKKQTKTKTTSSSSSSSSLTTLSQPSLQKKEVKENKKRHAPFSKKKEILIFADSEFDLDSKGGVGTLLAWAFVARTNESFSPLCQGEYIFHHRDWSGWDDLLQKDFWKKNASAVKYLQSRAPLQPVDTKALLLKIATDLQNLVQSWLEDGFSVELLSDETKDFALLQEMWKKHGVNNVLVNPSDQTYMHVTCTRDIFRGQLMVLHPEFLKLTTKQRIANEVDKIWKSYQLFFQGRKDYKLTWSCGVLHTPLFDAHNLSILFFKSQEMCKMFQNFHLQPPLSSPSFPFHQNFAFSFSTNGPQQQVYYGEEEHEKEREEEKEEEEEEEETVTV